MSKAFQQTVTNLRLHLTSNQSKMSINSLNEY